MYARYDARNKEMQAYYIGSD